MASHDSEAVMRVLVTDEMQISSVTDHANGHLATCERAIVSEVGGPTPRVQEQLPQREDADSEPGSNDSLEVNVDDDANNNSDIADVEEEEDGGDDGQSDTESTTSSDSESDHGQGDMVSYISSTDSIVTRSSQTGSTTSQPRVHTTSASEASIQHLSTNKGKYGDFEANLRPRPPSGHRYVISLNEVINRKRKDDDPPSWGPSYAQRIECILNQVMYRDGPTTSPGPQLPNVPTSEIPINGFDLVFARLHGNPPAKLIEFDESSDSEESCIRSINDQYETRKKKSCLKISREGIVGECRPKILSWSQHVYVANIQSVPIEVEDNGKSQTKSCPGIYYKGEFSIRGSSSNKGSRFKYKHSSKHRYAIMMVARAFPCIRSDSPPPSYVESNTNLRRKNRKKTSVAAQPDFSHVESESQPPGMHQNLSKTNCCSMRIWPRRKKKRA